LDEVEAEVSKLPDRVPAAGAAPIQVATSQTERVPIYELVDEALEDINPVVRRVLIALTAIAHECDELVAVAEDEFFSALALFGWNKLDDDHKWGSGQLEEMMGRSLPLMQDINNYTQQCRDVLLNALQQLAGLMDASQKSSALWKNVELRGVVSRIGSLLRVLLTMDLLVRNNHLIKDGWAAFQRAVQIEGAAACGDDAKFRALRELVLSLDEGVMSGRTFARALHQAYDVGSAATGDEVVRVHANQLMHTEVMKRAVSLAVTAADAAAKGSSSAAEDLVGGMCVYALIRAVMPPGFKPDQRVYESLWKTQLQCPVVPLLGGRAVFLADDFLKEFCSISES
jgi:hypothetical protein